ncbi:AraC family transcriptional regulator [Sphingobium sp. H39-3-25]|uniref:helix-turn-helix transcriptional regulator n=1 Tax=Sphingobium arseniciresistens TaxID=3030834 RepID=UPI0023B9A9A8|nr:AraC family transcriptional regulator [Sphingobium arseniciresistens]
MSGEPDTNVLHVTSLLETAMLTIRDVRCSGDCRHKSPSECATSTQLVFPYRGAFMRHVGAAQTVAETNQIVFFNEDEEYAVSHPVDGGDACLSIAIDQDLLRELAPADQLEAGAPVVFRHARRGIDPRAQALVALLRHGLGRGAIETLEAETLALTLIRRSLGERTSKAKVTTYGKGKLVDRTKLLLASDPGRRWTLAAIARQLSVSPVYLTQVFAQAEGVPLYRYQLRLRLARALDLLAHYDDLTMLALDLGFSSHSHFTAAFRQGYGCSPAEFQRSVSLR